MINKLGDTQRLIIENILVYSIILVITLAWDFIFNLSVVTGINPGKLHPYSFGLYQAVMTLFCGFQIFRMGTWWKYYS